jgi:hypothetical protein
MTTIAKTARAALVVAVLALATAGAASADAFRPSTHHPDPGRIQTVKAWSSTGSSHSARFRPNAGGCMRGCVI